MNSITSNNHNRTKPIIVGTLLAATTALALYSLHSRRQSTSKTNENDSPSSKTNNRNPNRNDASTTSSTQLGISEENIPPHIRREIEKERRFEAKKELISMKSPMYDNVFMLDNDGHSMCTISLKKARWYVRKGIAEWATESNNNNNNNNSNSNNNNHSPQEQREEPKCIRLLFEPSGGNYQKDGTPENLYLKSAKQNVCVSCGSTDHHMRHYIVPYSYRTMLPDQYKAHMSHDIVILCPECHVRCEKATKTRMKGVEGGLREEFRRDASGENKEDVFCSPVIDDMELNHVRSCAIALVKWRDNMPLDKIESHETVVRDYLASTATEKENDTKSILLNTKIPLSKQQLQKACSVNYRVKNPNYVSGSELVMRFLDDDEKKIEEFIVDWRRHFVETVQPRFMPVGWSVDNPVVCGRTEGSGGDKDDSIKRW